MILCQEMEVMLLSSSFTVYDAVRYIIIGDWLAAT